MRPWRPAPSGPSAPGRRRESWPGPGHVKRDRRRCSSPRCRSRAAGRPFSSGIDAGDDVGAEVGLEGDGRGVGVQLVGDGGGQRRKGQRQWRMRAGQAQVWTSGFPLRRSLAGSARWRRINLSCGLRGSGQATGFKRFGASRCGVKPPAGGGARRARRRVRVQAVLVRPQKARGWAAGAMCQRLSTPCAPPCPGVQDQPKGRGGAAADARPRPRLRRPGAGGGRGSGREGRQFRPPPGARRRTAAPLPRPRGRPSSRSARDQDQARGVGEGLKPGRIQPFGPASRGGSRPPAPASRAITRAASMRREGPQSSCTRPRAQGQVAASGCRSLGPGRG